MVILNLTFFVQLGLFLVFLAVMHFLILRPTLRLMDAREGKIDKDRHAAEHDAAEAEQLETRYDSELGLVRHEAATQVAQAQRAAQQRHVAALAERRKQAEETVQGVRAAALGQVADERKRYDTLTRTLADAMVKRLGLGGRDP